MATLTMPGKYDARTIWLHWVSALLIIFMWGGAHAIDWFPKGPQRVDARSIHIVVGVTLLLLIAYRLVWRLRSGTIFDDPKTIAWRLSKVVHYLLYALILTTLAFGVANAWVRGDDLFGLGHIPKFGAYDPAARHILANAIVDWHRLWANALLLLGCGHGLAGLGHWLLMKDSVLQRMLP
jgi:cytochrome b561